MGLTRRNTVIGLGTLAAGAGLIGSTGAFSAVEADRTVSVEAAGDGSALLALAANDGEDIEPSGGTSSRDGEDLAVYSGSVDDYVGSVDDTVALVFDDDSDVAANINARTRFDDLLVVQNNGTQDVGLYIEDPENEDGEGNPTVDFLLWDGSETTSIVGGSGDAVTIGAGTHAGITVAINLWELTSVDEVSFPDSIRLVAEADLAE